MLFIKGIGLKSVSFFALFLVFLHIHPIEQSVLLKEELKTTIKGTVGPGWVMFSQLLLPQPSTENASLLSVANENSAWNLYTALSMGIDQKLYKNWYLSLELGGNILRNGRAIITDSNQLAFRDLILGVATANYTSVFMNLFDVTLGLGTSFEPASHIQCGMEGGYFLTKEFKALTFLNQPLIFFIRNSYSAGFAKAKMSFSLDNSVVSIAYKIGIGTINVRLTQNTGNIFVLRRIPHVIANAFSIQYSYTLKENIVLGCALSYANARNYKIGNSRTYTNGILTLNVNNVLSVLNREIEFLISAHWEY